MRRHTAREVLADRQIHRIGLSAAGLAAAWLVAVAATSGSAVVGISLLIYATGLLGMLGCSAAYSLATDSPRRELLRRLDHAAIFLMIAGTYTPFTMIRLNGAWSVAMTTCIWAVASAGIAMKLCRPRRLERTSILVYLSLGWAGLIALRPLVTAVDHTTLVLLGIGGMLYTLGVVFHLWRSLPFHTATWHGFVLSAASCHYVAVLHGAVAG
ncbi:MAG: PAQR family membrane homeostasis protein TrhA [Stellaceae bacterium]